MLLNITSHSEIVFHEYAFCYNKVFANVTATKEVNTK